MSRGESRALDSQLGTMKMLCKHGCESWGMADGLASGAEGHVSQFGINWSRKDLLPLHWHLQFQSYLSSTDFSLLHFSYALPHPALNA